MLRRIIFLIIINSSFAPETDVTAVDTKELKIQRVQLQSEETKFRDEIMQNRDVELQQIRNELKDIESTDISAIEEFVNDLVAALSSMSVTHIIYVNKKLAIEDLLRNPDLIAPLYINSDSVQIPLPNHEMTLSNEQGLQALIALGQLYNTNVYQMLRNYKSNLSYSSADHSKKEKCDRAFLVIEAVNNKYDKQKLSTQLKRLAESKLYTKGTSTVNDNGMSSVYKELIEYSIRS